jgi:hypothetical protein
MQPAANQSSTGPGVPRGSRDRTEEGSQSALLARIVSDLHAIHYLVIDPQSQVESVNPAFETSVGLPAADLCGRPVKLVLTERDAETVMRWVGGEKLPGEPMLLNFIRAGETPFTLRCIAVREGDRLHVVGERDFADERDSTNRLLTLNNAFASMTRELAKKTRELTAARDELASTLSELQSSHWHLRRIQEVIPVCMQCGKVKGDGVNWDKLHDYLADNDILMSHGYCPACARAELEKLGFQDDHEV